jgi:6-phosphogluconate dehydrogenase
MKVGIIGLGRMGEGMSRRLIKAGHEVWGYRNNYAKSEEQYEKGYISGCTTSVESLVQVVRSTPSDRRAPGIFMMVVPAETVEGTINELLQFCVEGDIIIDHGNSNFKDTRRRAELTVVLVVVFMVWSVDTVLWLVVQILQYPSALLSSAPLLQESMLLPAQTL